MKPKPLKNTVCLTIIIALLAILSIAAFYNAVMPPKSSREMQSYILGKADTCGYIGIKLTYSNEPVDVSITDPEGTEYTKDSEQAYYKNDTDSKTIILMADSGKLGNWSASFNKKRNTRINYSMVESPSETLYMSEPKIYKNSEGKYYIKFMPEMSDPKSSGCEFSITMNKMNFSYELTSGNIPLNKEAEIPLNFPEHVYTGEDYELEISVQAADAGINTKLPDGKSAHSTLNIHLEKHNPQAVSPDSASADMADEKGN